MTVIIGVDPHKSTHTAVAIGRDEQLLARVRRSVLVSIRRCWSSRARVRGRVF
jgi:hypothetical protein